MVEKILVVNSLRSEFRPILISRAGLMTNHLVGPRLSETSPDVSAKRWRWIREFLYPYSAFSGTPKSRSRSLLPGGEIGVAAELSCRVAASTSSDDDVCLPLVLRGWSLSIAILEQTKNVIIW